MTLNKWLPSPEKHRLRVVDRGEAGESTINGQNSAVKRTEIYRREDSINPIFPESEKYNDEIKHSFANGAYKEKTGTVMVGAAYAINSSYFWETGAYDEAMKVWGGENLEMSWRVILCGGSLIHVPCSHFGHDVRSQPYSFPGGRSYIEVFNNKGAIKVWMEPEYKIFVYHHFPEMTVIYCIGS